MSPGPTFERVYRALRTELCGARFSPGSPLEPARLSEELNSSITPVRDALHRLVGEGLVEAPRGDGFRTPLLTEMGLRHLYGFRGWLLAEAARRAAPADAAGIGAAEAQMGGADEGVAALFERVAALHANPELAASVAALNGRLGAAMSAEPLVLSSMAAEQAGLAEALSLGARPLCKAIAAYHRRRIKAAPVILATLHAL